MPYGFLDIKSTHTQVMGQNTQTMSKNWIIIKDMFHEFDTKCRIIQYFQQKQQRQKRQQQQNSSSLLLWGRKELFSVAGINT